MNEESKPYNPLDTDNLGESLVRQLILMDPVRMDKLETFPGAGVYAIYYTGDHPAYVDLAKANKDAAFKQAIYVGKAIPSGGRKGTVALGNVTGRYLHKRLSEHAESLKAASNLDVTDFYARWLVVEPIWIPLIETLMINRSACVWNAVVEGFGNHNPGKNRSSGTRTKWDTMHPGRQWAETATTSDRWTEITLRQEAKTWIAQRL